MEVLGEEIVELDSPEVEAVSDTEPALDPGEDEANKRLSVSRRGNRGGEGMISIGLVLEECLVFDNGEMKAEELLDALVKIEAYEADFSELAETLEDLGYLLLGDVEVGDLDLDLDLELMGKGLENKR